MSLSESIFLSLEFIVLLSDLLIMVIHLFLHLSLVSGDRKPHLVELLIKIIDIGEVSLLLLGSLLLCLLKVVF